MKYSNDRLVSFDPEKHIYIKDGKKLEGVTSFISRHKQKFDADSVAEKYSKKHGLDKAEVLAMWKTKGDFARDAGTGIHDIFESYFISKAIRPPKTDKEKSAVKFINDYFVTKKLIPIECESIVYGDNLASMIDMVVENMEGKRYILDWKSSKEVSKNGYGKTMFHPFSDCPDANFYHYSIQTSIYKQLYPGKIEDCIIIHINEYGYSIIKSQYIPCPKFLL